MPSYFLFDHSFRSTLLSNFNTATTSSLQGGGAGLALVRAYVGVCVCGEREAYENVGAVYSTALWRKQVCGLVIAYAGKFHFGVGNEIGLQLWFGLGENAMILGFLCSPIARRNRVIYTLSEGNYTNYR